MTNTFVLYEDINTYVQIHIYIYTQVAKYYAYKSMIFIYTGMHRKYVGYLVTAEELQQGC